MTDVGTTSYTLMHKHKPVAEIELDPATVTISSIGRVYAQHHVPVGIPVKKGKVDRAALNEWWSGRAIPASRDGIAEALLELHLSTTQKLLDKSYGLSLSDHYWIRPSASSLKWSDINFFENAFTEDVGNVLFGKGASDAISLVSPDNTTDGWLKKKWAIMEGKRCLVKGGSGAVQQEPYNEVIATRIMERLGIPHVPYELIEQEDYPYSVCENFTTPQTELVTAWYIMHTRQKPNHVSVYQHYINCCEALGIPGIVEALDRMIVVDYLIANEDRHQNNFGAIRHAERLEWIGAAPIYDSGSSLWFSKPLGLIGSDKRLTCKPFKQNHREQIKLVTTFEWLNLSALDGIEEEINEIFQGSIFVDEARAQAIGRGVRGRIEQLQELIFTLQTQGRMDDQAADVRQDIAYSGRLEGDERAHE
ncbi:excisionase [Paenibacillus sp. 598K]|uniref:HipA domain-containing protein n=1 Tax=Paenibacillus sp. 598K TaxID=1117987 RepID=UPI000FF9539C|nr:HipA domain-containing protein [Paenibacillus sp. 598K]GBF75735.1 excisionase [Paenibacillus sp. 598K]